MRMRLPEFKATSTPLTLKIRAMVITTGKVTMMELHLEAKREDLV